MGSRLALIKEFENMAAMVECALAEWVSPANCSGSRFGTPSSAALSPDDFRPHSSAGQTTTKDAFSIFHLSFLGLSWLLVYLASYYLEAISLCLSSPDRTCHKGFGNLIVNAVGYHLSL